MKEAEAAGQASTPFDAVAYQETVLKPALAAFHADGSLPDYFARYGLSPDVSDGDVIRRAISDVLSYWNRQKNNASYGPLLGVLLEPKEVERTRTVLTDPRRRLEQRTAVEAMRREQALGAERELESYVRIIAAKGYRTAEETQRIITRFKTRGFTVAQIEERLKVPLRDGSRSQALDEGLPASTRANIRKHLAVFKQKTLYDFIGVAPDAPVAEVEARYEETVESWKSRPVSEQKAAAQVLLAQVKLYLINEDGSRYRAALDYERLEGLRSRLEVAAADKRIDRHEFSALRVWAVEQGIADAAATDIILAMADQIKAHVEWTDTPFVVCGYCNAATPDEPSVQHCRACGEPLRIECAQCKASMSTSQTACTACGYHLTSYLRLRSLTPRFEQALDLGDLRAASALLEQCRGVLPKGAELSRLGQALEARREALESLRRSFDECVRTRLRSAAQTLRLLTSVAPGYVGADGRGVGDLEAVLETFQQRFRDAVQAGEQHLEAGRGDEAWSAFRVAA
ncbi:MAG: zinc ribbon domain-containing protein, partial [Proteobacteria bacterium]|nr:zinc ribbon domain-containing protein [Pseudomonadota bacterium]